MHICPSCGQTLEQNDRFCIYCGALLQQPPEKGRWWPPVLALILIFSIGLGVFFLFPSESLITTDPTMPWFTVRDGVLYFDDKLYTGDNQLTVPSSVGGQAVTALSDNCFSFCTDLIAVELPEGITYIGSDAFWGCENLRGIRLPETVTAMGDRVFEGCSDLEAICLPAALTDFGRELFTDCDRLSYVFYTGSVAQWKDLGIGAFAPGTILSCSDGLYQIN